MEYWLNHRPTDIRDYPEFRADRILDEGGAFPGDILSRPELYFPDSREYGGRLTAMKLRKMQGHPDMDVTIYRGAPADRLNTGDWVTLSPEYAELYAGNGAYSDNPGSKARSYTVKAKELSFDGDSIHELGYWGQPTGPDAGKETA